MASTIVAPPHANDVLGSSEIRVEGRDKVSGKMKYTADMHAPDMLWAAFTTSPLAHARIVSIDTSEARALPGVHTVITSADIGPGIRSGRAAPSSARYWPPLESTWQMAASTARHRHEGG